jgi:hypothetical protein
MHPKIKEALQNLENKHYAAVQTDTRLGLEDTDSERFGTLEQRAQRLWKEYREAKREIEGLLDGLVPMESPHVADDKDPPAG